MMATVHALLGAAVGGFFRKRGAAFTAGVLSHAVGDALPHGELPAALDVLTAGGVVALLCRKYGVESPQVAGAVGGIIPDIEHGLSRLGVINERQKLFPTHRPGMIPHGRRTKNPTLQVLVGATSLLIIAVRDAEANRRDAGTTGEMLSSASSAAVYESPQNAFAAKSEGTAAG